MKDRSSRGGRVLGLVAVAVLLAMLLPAGSALAIDPVAVAPATGGTGISTATAATGGSGAWTSLSGPTITESVGGQLANSTLAITVPSGFEFNSSVQTPPVLGGSGCGYTATSLTYFGAGFGSTIVRTTLGGAVGSGACTITFTALQIRPLTTTPASGSLQLQINEASAGAAGAVSSVTPAPPPSSLSLSITSPTMNNSAIIWGQSFIDIRTAGAPGTTFSIEATTDQLTWTPLKNSSGAVLSWTIGSSGSSTYRYTPIRNYWYRSVAGSTTSNVVRITVRQTCALRPTAGSSSPLSVAPGTSLTFNATVRPARSDLPTANVVFQVYRRSGSSWVLASSVTKAINDSGVASLAWTFSSAGSWYVRAQAQPTSVNSNSFWTPNTYVNVG